MRTIYFRSKFRVLFLILLVSHNALCRVSINAGIRLWSLIFVYFRNVLYMMHFTAQM